MTCRSTPLMLCALTLALAVSACKRRSEPEAEVRQAIADMVEAVEGGQLADFMDHIAPTYSDRGSNDIGSLRGQMFVLMQRHTQVRVTYRVESITLGAGEAPVTSAEAVVIAGVADGPIIDPNSGSEVLRFELQFVRDSDWQVRRADWDRVSAAALLGF